MHLRESRCSDPVKQRENHLVQIFLPSYGQQAPLQCKQLFRFPDFHLPFKLRYPLSMHPYPRILQAKQTFSELLFELLVVVVTID